MVQQALAAATGTAAIGAARRGPAGRGERDERVSAGRSSGRTGGGMDAPSEAPAWPGDGLPAPGGLPVPPAPRGGLVRDARPAVEERDLLVRLRDGDELAFARLYE